MAHSLRPLGCMIWRHFRGTMISSGSRLGRYTISQMENRMTQSEGTTAQIRDSHFWLWTRLDISYRRQIWRLLDSSSEITFLHREPFNVGMLQATRLANAQLLISCALSCRTKLLEMTAQATENVIPNLQVNVHATQVSEEPTVPCQLSSYRQDIRQPSISKDLELFTSNTMQGYSQGMILSW